MSKLLVSVEIPLSADAHIPKTFPKNSPLVVVLHGSAQSAESYDIGSGGSTLANECGMAFLFPGQRLTNNLTGKFNWFKTGDSQRGGGEPLSIRQMIKQEVGDYAVDPSRVFPAGMSLCAWNRDRKNLQPCKFRSIASWRPKVATTRSDSGLLPATLL